MIIAGAGSNDTAHATRIATSAEKAGADGLLVVSPYYNRPSQEGVYRHIRTIVEATSLPAMVYDIPGRTGVAIGDDCLYRLAAVEQIIAIKDATGDVPQGFDRMRRTGLELYVGYGALTLEWLGSGAAGVVSVVGHVVAAQYRNMVQAIDERDLDTARDLAAQLSPMVEGIMGGGQGAVMAKTAVHLQRHIDQLTVRSPLVQADEAELAALRDVLLTHNLLEN